MPLVNNTKIKQFICYEAIQISLAPYINLHVKCFCGVYTGVYEYVFLKIDQFNVSYCVFCSRLCFWKFWFLFKNVYLRVLCDNWEQWPINAQQRWNSLYIRKGCCTFIPTWYESQNISEKNVVIQHIFTKVNRFRCPVLFLFFFSVSFV